MVACDPRVSCCVPWDSCKVQKPQLKKCFHGKFVNVYLIANEGDIREVFIEHVLILILQFHFAIFSFLRLRSFLTPAKLISNRHGELVHRR